MMTCRHFRGGGTSVASIFSNMRSIRMALGFISADHPRCPGVIVPICSRRDIDLGFLGSDPRIRNVVDDLLHTRLKLLLPGSGGGKSMGSTSVSEGPSVPLSVSSNSPSERSVSLTNWARCTISHTTHLKSLT